MTTRAAVLRRAFSLVPRLAYTTKDGVNALTSTSGAATTLIDTANQMPTGFVTATHKNWFLCRPAAAAAADKVRIVSSYTASTSTWTHGGPNYTNSPTTERYLLTKDPLNLWETALNEALQTELFQIRFDEFSPVSNTRRIYQVDGTPISVTDLDRVADVHNIQWHPETDATNEEQWQDWYNGRGRLWHVFEDAGTLYIDFGSGRLPGTTDQLRLIVTQPYATLTDETTVSLVDEEWAAYATLLVMCRLLADLIDPRNEWTKVLKTMTPDIFCRDRRRAELAQYAYRTVERSSQRVGGVRVAGRAGR